MYMYMCEIEGHELFIIIIYAYMYSYRSVFVAIASKMSLFLLTAFSFCCTLSSLPRLQESSSLIVCPSAGHLLAMYRSTRMHEHTCDKRELPRSRARVNYWVPGYASLSRLNPDSIHLGGESRLDPNYCASVNTALGCTLCIYNIHVCTCTCTDMYT